MILTDNKIIVTLKNNIVSEGIVIARLDNKSNNFKIGKVVNQSCAVNNIKIGDEILFEKHKAVKWQDGQFLIYEKDVKALLK